jgi:hypothetical protein
MSKVWNAALVEELEGEVEEILSVVSIDCARAQDKSPRRFLRSMTRVLTMVLGVCCSYALGTADDILTVVYES